MCGLLCIISHVIFGGIFHLVSEGLSLLRQQLLPVLQESGLKTFIVSLQLLYLLREEGGGGGG